MDLLLRTVRLGSPRQTKEELRIGTVRFLPRGVQKKDYARLDYFDVWLPTLAPSRELFAQLKATNMSFQTFLKRYRSEMGKADARQTIQLLAELAKRTPISVGCYCEDEGRCHRSVLGKLIREAAGLPAERPLSDFCVYTIRHPDELAKACELGQRAPWHEKKRWVQAERLLAATNEVNVRLPIVFADATDCSRLTHWAIVRDIRTGEHGTDYDFHSLRALLGRHSPQELILRSTGRNIAQSFIRPYAICKTPNFVE